MWRTAPEELKNVNLVERIFEQMPLDSTGSASVQDILINLQNIEQELGVQWLSYEELTQLQELGQTYPKLNKDEFYRVIEDQQFTSSPLSWGEGEGYSEFNKGTKLTSGYSKLSSVTTTEVNNYEDRRIQRVTNALNQKLVETEEYLAQVSNEATKKLRESQLEIQHLKGENLSQRRYLSQLSSELESHQDKLAEKDWHHSKLLTQVTEYKTNQVRLNQQYKLVKEENLKLEAQLSSHTILSEKYLNLKQDYYDLLQQCSQMKKVMRNWEMELSHTRTINSYNQQLVQENSLLEEKLAALSKPTPSALNLTSTLSHSHNSSLESLSGYSYSDSCSSSVNNSLLRLSDLNPDPGGDSDSTELRRQLNTTWREWGRVKRGLTTVLESYHDLHLVKQKVKVLLNAMEKLRPPKRRWKKLTMQQVLNAEIQSQDTLGNSSDEDTTPLSEDSPLEITKLPSPPPLIPTTPSPPSLLILLTAIKLLSTLHSSSSSSSHSIDVTKDHELTVEDDFILVDGSHIRSLESIHLLRRHDQSRHDAHQLLLLWSNLLG